MPRWYFRATFCFFSWSMYKAIVSISGNIPASRHLQVSRMVNLSRKGPAACLQTAGSCCALWVRCLRRLELNFHLQPLPHSYLCGRARATQALLSPSLFPYPNIWETAYGSIYTNKLHLFHFQLGLIKSADLIKLIIKKKTNETILIITINVNHFKYNHSNKSRKTLNYSVQERRKAKRYCSIIFCNSE